MTAQLIWRPDHYIIEYSGNVTVDESVRVYGKLVGCQEFDTCRFGILDCRKVEKIDYSEMDYKKHAAIAQSAAKVKSDLRIAMVVTESKTEASIRRFLKYISEQFQHPWERRIFHDYDAALAWASGSEDATAEA